MHPVLFVGESNPRTADPRYALYPWPRTSAGARLADHLGLTPSEYLRRAERVNLFAVDRWSAREARHRADFIASIYREVSIFVLLGRRVAVAFRHGDAPFFKRVGNLVVIPHPSGRCREWNDPRARTRLRRLLNPYLRGKK